MLVQSAKSSDFSPYSRYLKSTSQQQEFQQNIVTTDHVRPIVVFRSDEKIGYGIVWELQNDDRSLDAHDRLLLTLIKIFIHPK